MQTIVQKPFRAEGKDLQSGTVVDSTGWRNEDALIRTRFLRPLQPGEEVPVQTKPRRMKAGRRPHANKSSHAR